MKTKTLKTLLIVTLLSLSLSACAGSAASLEGTSWQLIDFAGKPPVGNTQPTMTFEDGNVGGNSSCNTYGGEYKTKGDKIEFGMMMSTMMACLDDGVMEQEQEFLAFLGSVERWELSNGQLLLFDARGNVLVFEAQN